ncbi:MAG: beta-ketoacyl-[acyl-carrier-protein] synthase family protein [Phycisphaeraceae bacterium]|nr:beta-ketoacyl-[acyl-carrier-protein] synthase family protein [Phycisphaeraceae bacterium]
MSKRVVITGIGWVTPLGHDRETVWENLLAGRSAIGPTQQFDASTYPTTFSAEVRDYDFRPWVRHPEAHEHAGPNTLFALGAARQAWTMAGLDESQPDLDRVGIYLGSGEGAQDFDNYTATHLKGWDPEKNDIDMHRWLQAAKEHINMWRESEQESNMTLSHLAVELEAAGPAYNCLTACAASTQAIGEATEMLRRGDADVMVSGGAHSMIHPLGVTGFNLLTALSERNDDPATASRPFNRTRDGFVLGEGSGMVILETLDHARARGAEPLAEVIGYGSSADAYRITDIHPEGRGPVAAMRAAMAQAEIGPADVDYISAHGTGTKENDSIETRSIKTVFGEDAKKTPMSSIKSMMGHLIAAAGACELITCVLSIRDQKIPPTINLNEPDPDLDLDYVPNESRSADVRICLSNSFGFGGQNDTLVIRRFEP